MAVELPIACSPASVQQPLRPRTPPVVAAAALADIPGVFGAMLIAFGRHGIRTVEDLAACATDDLVGWTECQDGVITTYPGILADMPVSRKDCDAIILQARVRAGWIDAAAVTI
jgi:N utilization substance protein A